VAEQVVEKERKRWLVAYRGVEFYVHLDQLRQPPAGGWFVEVKSRTWSRRDARDKAAVMPTCSGCSARARTMRSPMATLSSRIPNP
jgi:hypothetical protein